MVVEAFLALREVFLDEIDIAEPTAPLLLRDARRFRAELTLPLILLGGITDRASMDLAMAEGFQFVAMARALLAEPDLVNRIAAEADGLYQ